MFDTIVLLGPTASGKSALALQLAQIIQSEIISLDSALVYKGMDIGSAKPTKEELKLCCHHLIDICEVEESYSAANFRQDCINLVKDISARHKKPIICGGTMMYYKALVDGLSPLPPSDDKVRHKVALMIAEQGIIKAHAFLHSVDPLSAQKLAMHDKQRISRALEVYFMTNKPMSSFFSAQKESCPFSRLEIVLLPQNDERTLLREKIKERFLLMLDKGLIDEVKALKEKNLDPSLPAMRAVGYRQVLMYLNEEINYEQMIELSVIASARLAKHQMTWLRGGLKDENALDLRHIAFDKAYNLILEHSKLKKGKSLRYYLALERDDSFALSKMILDLHHML